SATRTCRARCRSTRASCTRGTSPRCCSTSRRRGSSRSIGTTRSPPARASPGARACRREDLAGHLRAHHPGAGDLRRLRGDLQGADAPAHPADVRDQRHPRHRPGRSDHRGRPPAPADLDPGHRAGRRVPRNAERRRRLRRHRPDAGDVQEAQAGCAERRRRTACMSRNDGINLLYLITIVTFILALRFLSSPATARRGNWLGAVGMVIAIVATFLQRGLHNYASILIVMAVAAPIGAYAARAVKMTAMPQMVALFNGVGGGAAALVSLAEFHRIAPATGNIRSDIAIGILLSALIGSISFAGSMIAFAKLQELIGGRPIVYQGQQIGNLLLLGAVCAAAIVVGAGYQHDWLLVATIAGALAFGVLFVLPIGGADMPVVISMLNAFTGLAAS